MPSHPREISFAAFVTEQRPMLQGVAYLLHGDVLAAESVVDASLAQLYDTWPLIGNAQDVALRRVVTACPADLNLPWKRGSRLELIDGASVQTNGIVGDLAAMPSDQRRALLLERFAHLPILRIAGILDQGANDVQRLVQWARDRLTTVDRARADDTLLEAELAAAIPYDLRTAASATIDIAHGKRLVRQRVGRRLAVTTVAVVALASAALWAPRTQVGSEVSSPTTTPVAVQSTSPPPCEGSDDACRVRVLSAWRSRMADIVQSYVDPKHTYYAGYSYQAEPIYETPTFWQGRGGILGLELSPVPGNATVVFLQIARAPDLAILCGNLSKQTCFSQRFMDGNSYTITKTVDPTEGIEVQFSPTDHETVTIVAKNVRRGRTLDINTGDLIKVVQDSRLRLPHG